MAALTPEELANFVSSMKRRAEGSPIRVMDSADIALTQGVVVDVLHVLQPGPAQQRAAGLRRLEQTVQVRAENVPVSTLRAVTAAYTGLFTPIRELFSGVPESRSRGYGPGLFPVTGA